MNIVNKFIGFSIFSIGEYSFTIGSILTIVIIGVIAKLLLMLIKKILFNAKNLNKVKEVNLYSLFQIIKYIIWTIATLLILKTIGLNLGVIWAGSAALLVGIGLGLQNTFNDFISGVILLFEGSIRIGDVLKIDNEIVKIQNIGLRTSEAINRDDISIIIPNSLIITSKVVNWSHPSKKTRFRINVGVAYGSDVDLVLKLLKESASEYPEMTDKNLINARFINFGNSSLDFELLFFSRNVFRIENVKSEIRKIINQKFIENNITIPFPQMDLHLESNYTEKLS